MINLSPTFTKNGTWTVKPVSTVAGLDPPLAVSPLMPGSVSATSSVTVPEVRRQGFHLRTEIT